LTPTMGRIVVAVPAVLLDLPPRQLRTVACWHLPPCSLGVERPLLDRRVRAFGGSPSALSPSAASRPRPLLPRGVMPEDRAACQSPLSGWQWSSAALGCSASCPPPATPRRCRSGRLRWAARGWPSIPWLRPAPEANARSGRTQRTLRRSSITRFGGRHLGGPPSTKNGMRHPAVTARPVRGGAGGSGATSACASRRTLGLVSIACFPAMTALTDMVLPDKLCRASANYRP